MLKLAFLKVDWGLDLHLKTELISPGTRLGKYEIVHRIAYGGMAEIYLARASGIEGFEKYVVLKRILPQFAANEEFVRMFLREARLAATLDQANIAHVYDIGETDGTYFFTMEYLHGEDLRWIMRKLIHDQRRLPLQQAMTIIIGAAAGLHFAHERKSSTGRPLGIVHRDMSPSNVVVTYDGGVKVVDFGVATMAADPELSKRYALKGKLAYMSPEQLHNRTVDKRSDLFSLGVVLYEITTHARLFKGHNEVETMRLVLESAIPPPSRHDPDYPPELERIVMRALQKNPDERYASTRDLQLDLEAFARDTRLQISSAGLAEWMEQSFGPKREIWHSLPASPAAPPVQETPTASTSAAAAARATQQEQESPGNTRVVVHEAVAPSRPGAAGSSGATPITQSLAEPQAAKHLRPALSRRLAAAALLGGVTALGIAFAAWFARGHAAPPGGGSAGTGTSGQVVMVVAEQGSVAVERPTAEPLPAPKPAALPTATLAPTVATAAGSSTEPSVAQAAIATAPERQQRGRRSSASPASGFTAAFARRQDEIRLCFATHSRGAPDSDGEISLRFQVGVDGRVTSVVVLPAATAATPLGACLAQIATRTVFAPQPAPIAFRIPLTLGRRVAHEADR